MTTRPFSRILFLLCLFLLHIQWTSPTAAVQKAPAGKDYQCLPCGSSCDKKSFKKPGKCPHCNMQLVKKSTVRFKTIQPSDLCAYIQNNPDVVLLDVRTKEEFDGSSGSFGTLQNAINVPLQALEEQLSALAPYKDKEIIVYCSRSRRSPQASYILTQNGFAQVTNLAGGMSAMKDRSCMK